MRLLSRLKALLNPPQGVRVLGPNCVLVSWKLVERDPYLRLDGRWLAYSRGPLHTLLANLKLKLESLAFRLRGFKPEEV